MLDHDLSAWLPGKAIKWQLALGQLLQAEVYARDTSRPSLQFAVQIDALISAGLTANDLRWLVAKDYIQLVSEIGTPDFAAERKFYPRRRRSAARRRCAILTAAGLAVAERTCCSTERDTVAPSRKQRKSNVPRWDAASRTLWIGTKMIQRLTVTAGNQESVLDAFEKQGWPSCVEDPIPPADRIPAKRRLHDTIIRLNHSHKLRLIRFSGKPKTQAP